MIDQQQVTVNMESTRPNKMEAFLKKVVLGDDKNYFDTSRQLRAEALEILINKKPRRDRNGSNPDVFVVTDNQGFECQTTLEEARQIGSLFRDNKILEAVKMLRTVGKTYRGNAHWTTGDNGNTYSIGLKEAKDAVHYMNWPR